MRSYQVFRIVPQEAGKDLFERLGRYDAHDGKDAVAKAVLALPEKERAASFACCAASSWQELTPTVKTETRVSFKLITTWDGALERERSGRA